jgi:signal transduction histidine kinase
MRRRLLASYLALAIVVLAALEIPLGVSYSRSERRDLLARIEHDALAVGTIAEDSLEAGARQLPVKVSRVARSYARRAGGRVLVVDASRRVLLDTEPGGDSAALANRPEIALALTGQIASGDRASKTLGHPIVFVAVPVASAGTVLGAVRITYPASALQHRILRYWGLLAAIAGVVLVAVSLVGLRLARTVTLPLTRLGTAFARVESGALETRVAVDGPPEIRELAARFNDMVDRLDTLLRAQRDFVADASHQLRTPLTALRLRLENLAHDTSPERRDVEHSLDEVERLARIVDQLLALARADAGSGSPVPLALAPIVAARIDAWRPQAEARSVELHPDVPATLVARATPELAEQALDNLLSNALAASPPGATVRVTASATVDAVELHVVDEGPGMTAEQRERALDRFWRARAGPGSGLGLAIAARLAAADGGSVELRPAPSGGIDAVIRLRA